MLYGLALESPDVSRREMSSALVTALRSTKYSSFFTPIERLITTCRMRHA